VGTSTIKVAGSCRLYFVIGIAGQAAKTVDINSGRGGSLVMRDFVGSWMHCTLKCVLYNDFRNIQIVFLRYLRNDGFSCRSLASQNLLRIYLCLALVNMESLWKDYLSR
jgi:hypothetical protein